MHHDIVHVCSGIFALFALGCCLVEVTIPLSGSNIVGDLGDENITIFCELTQDEMEQATIWALMREGQIQTPITIPDPNFDLTGDPLTDNTDFFLNTNLTILKLTEDLNNAVIYCGVPATPEAANFTIRLYSESDNPGTIRKLSCSFLILLCGYISHKSSNYSATDQARRRLSESADSAIFLII